MSATRVATFKGLTYTGPPIPCQIGNEQVFVLVGRDPEGKGPLCWAYVVAGDGRYLIDSPLDLWEYAWQDAEGNPVEKTEVFGASVFVSRADPAQGGGTIKFALNGRLDGENGRSLVIVSTGKVPIVSR